MAIDFTKRIKNSFKREGLDDVSTIAMADLMAIGWNPLDAFIVAFRPSMAIHKGFAEAKIKAITDNAAFKSYVNKRSRQLSNIFGNAKKSSSNKSLDDDEYEGLSREDVLKRLESMEASLPSDEVKLRTDVLMKIADLKRFKDNAHEDNNTTKHYYLPKKCFSCEYYKGREKDKLK